MKDYIIENQGLINQSDYLQLSLVVVEVVDCLDIFRNLRKGGIICDCEYAF